jgi:hypothetical protein
MSQLQAAGTALPHRTGTAHQPAARGSEINNHQVTPAYSSPISHPGTSLPFPNFLVDNLTGRDGMRMLLIFS